MTALASSFSPTVRADIEEPWGTSTSLSFSSYRVSSPPRLTVNLGDQEEFVQRAVLKAASAQLGHLLALSQGWDGGKAKPVSQPSAILSMHLIAYLVDDILVMPHLFPLPDGGIQLEWLIDGNGLEIEVAPNGEISAIGTDAGGQTQVDDEFGAGTDGRAIAVTRTYLRMISKPLFTGR
jgi:hypothetical protein